MYTCGWFISGSLCVIRSHAKATLFFYSIWLLLNALTVIVIAVVVNVVFVFRLHVWKFAFFLYYFFSLQFAIIMKIINAWIFLTLLMQKVLFQFVRDFRSIGIQAKSISKLVFYRCKTQFQLFMKFNGRISSSSFFPLSSNKQTNTQIFLCGEKSWSLFFITFGKLFQKLSLWNIHS